MPRLSLTRRRLLGLIGLAGVGGATAACAGGAGTAGQPGGSATSKPGQKIADVSALPVGGVMAFTEPDTDRPAVLCHPDESTFVAFRAVCTHAGCTVAFSNQQDVLACPCHGSEFDPATGEVVRGPAKRPLKALPVAQKNGVIETA